MQKEKEKSQTEGKKKIKNGFLIQCFETFYCRFINKREDINGTFFHNLL